MKKRKLKIIPCLIFGVILLLIIAVVSLFIAYNVGISKVNNSDKVIEFNVPENATYYSLSYNLKKKNLIKSEFFYKIYLKLNKPSNLKAGNYSLKSNMDLNEIIKILSNDPNYKSDIRITFKEGLNMRNIIKIITQNTKITESDILLKLNDENYLNELIKKYWFLTNEIKNKDIYYSLEGYLFPDTYDFNKNVTIDKIFDAMLDNTQKKLQPYKTSINNSKYTYHQLLTLASIVELESVGNDRSGVAGVFYNRLNNNWSLGSDVTTYYGAKIDINERDLYQAELDDYNAYNTRNSQMAGKLPIGPICNPGIDSVAAVLNPTKSNYFYFVADKNKKTYYSKTYNEHLAIINKLKKDDLWYEY